MIKVLALAAVTALVSLAPLATPASAQDLELRIGPNGVEPRIRERERDYGGPRYERRDYRRHHRDICGPDEAEMAARDYGMRHPRVVYMNDRVVVVEGMTRHGPDRIRFANEGGCPRLR